MTVRSGSTRQSWNMRPSVTTTIVMKKVSAKPVPIAKRKVMSVKLEFENGLGSFLAQRQRCIAQVAIERCFSAVTMHGLECFPEFEYWSGFRFGAVLCDLHGLFRHLEFLIRIG